MKGNKKMSEILWSGPCDYNPEDLTGKTLEEAIEIAKDINFGCAYNESGSFNDEWAWDLGIKDKDGSEVINIVWAASQNMPENIEPSKRIKEIRHQEEIYNSMIASSESRKQKRRKKHERRLRKQLEAAVR